MRLLIILALVCACHAGDARSDALIKEAEAASVAYVAAIVKIAKAIPEPPIREDQKKELLATPEGKRYHFWLSVQRKAASIEEYPDLPTRALAAGHLLGQMYGALEAKPTEQPIPPKPPGKVRGGK